MHRSFLILLFLVVSLSLVNSGPKPDIPSSSKGTYSGFIRDLQFYLRKQNSPVTLPNEYELRDWSAIPRLIRHNDLDSCRMILQKYRYDIQEIFDPVTDGRFVAITEETPMQRYWGTFIFNRDHKKRLYVHVMRPVEEPNTLQIGAEVFRRLGAEWLFIDGSQKFGRDGNKRTSRQVQRTVFSRWHEVMTDLTHLTLSIRGFRSTANNHADVVVSNGRTIDQQWGISQISLAFRDSLRRAGFECMLAMYDSGYANLAGGSSREGIFSNDSVGFGHWLNIELSSNLRANSLNVRRFIGVIDHAMDLTGKKVSQEVNRAFGLVSPRVVRVDSRHRILFPPSTDDSYRIISFNPSQNKSDTIDLRMGNWLDLVGGKTSIVSTGDSVDKIFSRAKRHSGRNDARSGVVDRSSDEQSDVVVLSQPGWRDSAAGSGNESSIKEPIQTHRIPLKKVPVPAYTPEISSRRTPFYWNGILPADGQTPVSFFKMNAADQAIEKTGSATEFLIPLLHRAFHDESEQCIGVQMNSVLVDEIARLVAQHGVTEHQIGLVAEQDANGEYFLRVIPSRIHPKKPQNDLARKF
jgi:hypothetical protein